MPRRPWRKEGVGWAWAFVCGYLGVVILGYLAAKTYRGERDGLEYIYFGLATLPWSAIGIRPVEVTAFIGAAVNALLIFRWARGPRQRLEGSDLASKSPSSGSARPLSSRSGWHRGAKYRRR